MPTSERVSWWMADLIIVALLAVWRTHRNPWELMGAVYIGCFLASRFLWRRR